MVQRGAVWCSVLQCAAVCCSNTDNVSFKYVDSTLSIKSLKTKILMHSNKDLKTHINLCVKIDKGICNLRKLIESSDAIPPKTKYEKSLQDVLALQCVAVWCSVLQHVALRCSSFPRKNADLLKKFRSKTVSPSVPVHGCRIPSKLADTTCASQRR